MLSGWPEPGGDQQRAKLVTVQPGGMRLIIQVGTADMSSGRMAEEFFFDGVFVEPGDSAQAAGNGGPGPAAGFHIPGKALDIRAAGLEKVHVVLLAPAGVLAQVSAYASRVRLV